MDTKELDKYAREMLAKVGLPENKNRLAVLKTIFLELAEPDPELPYLRKLFEISDDQMLNAYETVRAFFDDFDGEIGGINLANIHNLPDTFIIPSSKEVIH